MIKKHGFSEFSKNEKNVQKSMFLGLFFFYKITFFFFRNFSEKPENNCFEKTRFFVFFTFLYKIVFWRRSFLEQNQSN